jgi:ribosomal protein S18 acetylase RimI-like enzyme
MKADEQQVDALADILADAFFEDPFYRYLLPDASARQKPLTWFMRRLVLYGIRYGTVRTTPGPLRGAAVWLGPESPTTDIPGMVRVGMWRAPWALGIRATARMLRVTGEWERWQKREPEQHWYLAVIGVTPAEQGKGLGGGLLRPVLQQADAAGRSCFLETMTEKNISFYRKYGFETAAQGTIEGRIPYWTMRRKPRRA